MLNTPTHVCGILVHTFSQRKGKDKRDVENAPLMSELNPLARKRLVWKSTAVLLWYPDADEPRAAAMVARRHIPSSPYDYLPLYVLPTI